jgi:hypothetical protein
MRRIGSTSATRGMGDLLSRALGERAQDIVAGTRDRRGHASPAEP